MLQVLTPKVKRLSLKTVLSTRILRQDQEMGLTTLFFGDGELRVPFIEYPVGEAIKVRIEARDVSLALSRPMDVSITNRLPGEIAELEYLSPPYVRATMNLGQTRLHALITQESVGRLALVQGLRAWVMIKAVAISGRDFKPTHGPEVRPWPSRQMPNREKL
jgi:molybdate transport system ATP-binding protein